MEITSLNFRDKSLVQVTIGYDLDGNQNYAVLSVVESDGTQTKYRIVALSEYSIYEDFGCLVISQCKLINKNDGIYLSLDPFNELESEEEKDNFFFRGKSIIVEQSKC